MFDLVLTESSPAAPLRLRAFQQLAGVLSTQAALALHDVRNQRQYLSAQIQALSRNPSRILSVDLVRAEKLIRLFERVTRDPEPEAATRLEPLLRLLDGPIARLELARDRMGACLAPQHARRHVRILVLPEALRRRRVQIQELEPSAPEVVRQPAPRCFGETGQAYIGWALNRLDLRTLILASMAYLREN